MTVPFPEPLCPEVIVIQEALLPAVQLHPDALFTLTDPLPPEALNELEVGEMV